MSWHYLSPEFERRLKAFDGTGRLVVVCQVRQPATPESLERRAQWRELARWENEGGALSPSAFAMTLVRDPG